MPLPTLTPEQRQQALEKAAEARRKRAELKAQLKSGNVSLASVLNKDSDDTVGKMKVASVLESFDVDQDSRGNAKASTDLKGGYQTNVPKIFAAGDMRRGQSLVVWAIREGRQAARAIDECLMGSSNLPR